MEVKEIVECGIGGEFAQNKNSRLARLIQC